MLIRHRLSGFVNPAFISKAGLLASNLFVPRHRNVLAVLGRPNGKTLIPASNIITNAGDVYYAQRMGAETPDNDFAELTLSSVQFSPSPSKTSDADDLASVIAGSNSAFDGTYPKTDDDDGDNSGAGADILSYLVSYATGDFNDADIEGGAIHVTGATFGAASGDPLLTAFHFASSFAKTASDTLKVFVNHEFTGV